MLRLAVVILASGSALLAGGCSSMGRGAADTARMTRHGMGEAVTAPLKDFGLVKSKVPAVLKTAAADPYKTPPGADCRYIAHEVAQLDLALGPDVDVPRSAGKATMVGRGSRAASDAALDAVRDLTTGWIPFRSTVRRLTGAADNQDEVEDAAHAGGLRRAYLKGLGLQMGCAHPAAPLPAPTREIVDAQPPASESVLVRASDAGAPGNATPTAAEPPAEAAVPAQPAPGSVVPPAAATALASAPGG